MKENNLEETFYLHINEFDYKNFYPKEREEKFNQVNEWLDWIYKKDLVSEEMYAKWQFELDKKFNQLNSNKRPTLFKLFLFLVVALILFFLGFVFIKNMALYENKDDSVTPTVVEISTIPFRGVLKDREGNIISNKTDVEFNIYAQQDSLTSMYKGSCTGQNGIIPNHDGEFVVSLGKDCNMPPLTTDVENSQKPLYLGIRISNSEEILPRYLIYPPKLINTLEDKSESLEETKKTIYDSGITFINSEKLYQQGEIMTLDKSGLSRAKKGGFVIGVVATHDIESENPDLPIFYAGKTEVLVSDVNGYPEKGSPISVGDTDGLGVLSDEKTFAYSLENSIEKDWFPCTDLNWLENTLIEYRCNYIEVILKIN